MTKPLVAGLLLAACGASAPADPDASRLADAAADTSSDALVMLDPMPGTYRQTCDGSGAIALDFEHFLDVNDENQTARIYRRATSAGPVQQLDLNAGLSLAATDEADLEDVARIGTRLYMITSHGRNTSGALRPARYRFGAFDVSGTVPDVVLTPAGVTTSLLADLLDAQRWDAPGAAENQWVRIALEAGAQLGQTTNPDLAPEIGGINIEGLASDGTGKLVIGFRGPRPSELALVVQLANPSEVVAGEPPRFGGASSLDLGGLGIRGMTWSAEHAAILILAGPHNSGGPFRIFTWSGVLGAAPVLEETLTAPAGSAPEAIVTYPGTKDVQVLFDQGDELIAGTICKDVPVAERRFTDVIVHVD